MADRPGGRDFPPAVGWAVGVGLLVVVVALGLLWVDQHHTDPTPAPYVVVVTPEQMNRSSINVEWGYINGHS